MLTVQSAPTIGENYTTGSDGECPSPPVEGRPGWTGRTAVDGAGPELTGGSEGGAGDVARTNVSCVVKGTWGVRDGGVRDG